MKCDPDLIRKMVLAIEDAPSGWAPKLSFVGRCFGLQETRKRSRGRAGPAAVLNKNPSTHLSDTTRAPRFPAPAALARIDPLCSAQHNGCYVEFRIMLSQGSRDENRESPIRVRL